MLTQLGGSGGGGAELSGFGRMVVETYRAMEREAATAVVRRLYNSLEQVLANREPAIGGP